MAGACRALRGERAVSSDLAARYQAALAATMGPPARLVTLSKTHYCAKHPDHLVVFNANVCFDEGKAWWGDVDLTLEEARIVRLAGLTGESVYVLYESDGRFENEDAPRLDQA